MTLELLDLDSLSGRRLLVVGDVILDRYIRGSVDRISPEAPVPVVRVRGEDHRPGGAANVAANLTAVGARAELISAVGNDDGGAILSRLIEERGVIPRFVPTADRPTSVKTRIIAQHQQVVRLDQEEDHPIPQAVAEEVLAKALVLLNGCDGLIISDYAKGLLDERTLPPLLRAARNMGVPAVIDPKIRHFPLYQPATVVTPNLLEASRATGSEIPRDQAGIETLARSILDRLDLNAVLITLGEAGMFLLPRDREPLLIQAQAREVFDVTGAGDTVTAVLGAALAGGLGLERAARWANAAAAVAVGRLGTVAVTRQDLTQFFRSGGCS